MRSELWQPLAHRNFRLLWTGFVVSQVGDMIQMLAQSWLVVDLTQSARDVGILAAAQSLPRLVFGLFAGVLVDRVDRRRLLLVTQVLAAVQSAVFLALLLAHRVTYGVLLVLALVLGVLDALNLTARAALMPTLVPKPMISRAVALQALGVNVTQLLAPSLGGLLLGWTGVAGCLVANLMSFSVLVFSLRAMDLPPHVPPAGGAAPVGEALREVFDFVRGRPGLRGSIVLAYALGLLGMPVMRLLSLFARVVLRTSEHAYGSLAAASGVGAVLASLLVTARASAAKVPRNTVVSALAFAGMVALFGHARSSWTAAAFLVVFGAAQMAFRSAVMTRIQTEVPDRLRGRVVSVLAMDFALWSFGAAGLGAVIDVLARAHVGAASASAALPPEALAWALTAVFTVAGGLCAVATAVNARDVLTVGER